MITGTHKVMLANVISAICFAVGIICVLALGVWLLFQFGLNGASSKWILLRACVWLAEIGSLLLFFKMPSIMAFVGWLNMALVLIGVFPWEESGLQNFFFQFIFDIAFFIAGSVGALIKITLEHSITDTSALPKLDGVERRRVNMEIFRYFISRIQGSPSVLTKAVLALFMLPIVCVAQPPHQLRIRIINAKTNQPIPDERLNVALRVDQVGSVAMATDKTGIILVDTGNANTIRILSNMHADCRPRAELYTNYSIDTIRQTGITTGNLCSSASPAPSPGVLTIFEIPKTYIPTYPAQPASNLPHSDENPHSPNKPQ